MQLHLSGVPGRRLRHWWVIVKLVITVVATSVLLACTSTSSLLADAARDPRDQLGLLPSSGPVLHAGAALVVVLAAAALSVYERRGLTRYGWRWKQAVVPARS